MRFLLSYMSRLNYSAPSWGFRSYSCIDAVHNRAIRFFLGVRQIYTK